MPRPRGTGAGAHAIPTSLKKTKGTFRPCRELPIEHVPIVIAGIPEPPEYLDAVALIYWYRMAPRLHTMGVLACEDGESLAQMCVLYAYLGKLRALIERDGFVLTEMNSTGNEVLKANPAAKMYAEADRRFLLYLSHFGLTPSSRGRVSIVVDKPNDKIDTYFAD